jgi:hypothetical protein
MLGKKNKTKQTKKQKKQKNTKTPKGILLGYTVEAQYRAQARGRGFFGLTLFLLS